MKNIKKFGRLAIIFAVIAAIITVVVVTAIVNNREEERTDENIDIEHGVVSGDLNIRVNKLGHGTEWLDNVAIKFEEKFPEVTVEIFPTTERQVIFGEIIGGEVKKYDLYFSETLLDEYVNALEPLDDIFNMKWENESKTIAEKLDKMSLAQSTNLDGKKYQIPSYISTYGLVYNSDFLSGELPVTTNELLALCDELKGSGITPFIFSGEKLVEYWNYIYSTWFAQYQGIEEYNLMQVGRNKNNEIDPSVAYLDGGLKAMQVCEDLLWFENRNIVPNSTGLQYVTAQRDFLTGKAAMMYNGSWLMNEMKELASGDDSIDLDVFRMTNVPIISSIVERLDYRNNGEYMTDEMLAKVVRAIDSGNTTYEGVSENDFSKIKEARNFIYAGGEGANAVIPKVAKNKELAKLFLRFMYSKEGINAFASGMTGNILPIKSVELDDRGYDNIPSLFLKDAYELMLTKDKFFNNTKNQAVSPYCFKTGTSIEKQFGSQNPKDRTRAIDSFNEKKETWTANDNLKFWNSMEKMGLWSK